MEVGVGGEGMQSEEIIPYLSSNPEILAFNVAGPIISKNKWKFWSQHQVGSIIAI